MKKCLTKFLFSAFFVVVLVTTSMAQMKVTGTVMDGEYNEPLIGATVQVKGTTVGTVTDISGAYNIMANTGDILVFSYTGFDSKEMTVGTDATINITMTAGSTLDEIVVVGYGSQSEKEITSAVVQLGEEEFNKGVISDPSQLLQGKVAGLQVYNRGGDPNASGTIRLRGISTIGANVQPLIVIDGIIGASLDNVDPNDIESMSVLKDGSAAAIYGSRGSSGVIIVTTKSGSKGEKMKVTYNGQFSISNAVNTVETLGAADFIAAGGVDLGSDVDYLDEVTQTGFRQTHGISASGGSDNTTYRISANIRETDGILKNTGFDQFNTRLNLSTRILDDKLKIDFNASYTNRNQQFGFNEALRYAVTTNPTAPIFAEDAGFAFDGTPFGGYFQTLGLFDSFNPIAVIEQNRNEGVRREFNFGANFGYSILENLTANFRLSQQKSDIANEQYYPTTSHFRGNASSLSRKGLANFYEQNTDFELYEGYLTYLTNFGSTDLTLTGGYSFQENRFEDRFFSIGDFPDDSKDFGNILEVSQDLQNAGFIQANSNASPDERIIAFFGRANATIDNAIFLNASIRREGSTKLGADNRWGWFPAFGVGVDINRYANIGQLDLFKVRLGYGVTGALPGQSGLSQEARVVENQGDGSVSTRLQRAANPDLKWEEKAETNLGIEIAAGRFSSTLDLYNRTISDFILTVDTETAVIGAPTQTQNAGELNTKGIELSLNYDIIQKDNFNYTSGIVLSSYKTKLNEFLFDRSLRGNLGAPGQNESAPILVQVGEEIGQIYAPIFDGVDDGGNPIFQDLNGNGVIEGDPGNALTSEEEGGNDFTVVGNGIPDLELGWTNTLSFGDWTVNAFFRGAFGHSLVNSFRLFYEPRLASQGSYNYVTTDKAVDGLTTARFSDLYVEKADFLKLDNLSISRRFNLNNKYFDAINLSLIVENAFVITGYTGTNPEPNLVDFPPVANGDAVDVNAGDVLAPGIDRRTNYFTSRAISLGINFNFK